jgi:hypothetical protein
MSAKMFLLSRKKCPVWDEIVARIDRLRVRDSQYQVFGAERHRYRLHPCLSTLAIRRRECALGVELPTELRTFYLEIGNGLVGPDHGLYPLNKFEPYRPAAPYPGVELFRSMVRDQGRTVHPNGYFELEKRMVRGLLAIIHQG